MFIDTSSFFVRKLCFPQFYCKTMSSAITSGSGSLKSNSADSKSFLNSIVNSRVSEGNQIENFDFDKTRCRVLSDVEEVNEKYNGILYWMNRDCRVQDNWAFLFSQRLARKFKQPIYVCVFLEDSGKIFTRRHIKFFTEGLCEVQKECAELKISFNVFNSTPSEILNLVRENKIGAVVCEFNPLRKQLQWQDLLKNELPEDIPLVQVDAHNIIPAWVASNKQESMARTLRIKMMKLLPKYLTGFPILSKHEYTGKKLVSKCMINVDEIMNKFHSEGDVKELSWAIGGTSNGIEMLRTFLNERLKLYGIESNDPSKNFTSNLSPWINFGHISAQRIALEVKKKKATYNEQVANYLEELIVRRELTDNYCYYNDNYDNINGACDWAKKTLKEHSKDKRQYVYTKSEFEEGKTHDEIWNAAQIQLLEEGKIHGYMRMYWCKKILEWTETPEKAIEMGLYLNDTYSLDGSDPNGFVGVMWSICGVHDQGWKERPIFGKIRYMVDYSLRRKFNVDPYISKYVKESTQVQSSSRGKKRKSSNK